MFILETVQKATKTIIIKISVTFENVLEAPPAEECQMAGCCQRGGSNFSWTKITIMVNLKSSLRILRTPPNVNMLWSFTPCT